MKGCHAYSAVDRPCYAWESDDGDGGAKQWGRNDKQDPGAIIDIHKIEVMVSEDNAGLAQAIPQRVKLKIDYYQIDVTDKKLVRAEISMLEKCTTVPPEEFGGNPTVISNMLDMDIDTCPVTWNGILKSQAYVLDVRFQGLDWCVPLRPRLLARAHARARARHCLARGCLARGCVARGCLARGCLARGCLARGCLARGCLAGQHPTATRSPLRFSRHMHESHLAHPRAFPTYPQSPNRSDLVLILILLVT